MPQACDDKPARHANAAVSMPACQDSFIALSGSVELDKSIFILPHVEK